MKNIIFCADGTWNGPGQDTDSAAPATPTNVYRLYVNLAGEDDQAALLHANEQERRDGPHEAPSQVAKYLHGVGDSNNPLVKMLGGTFGAGIIARIIRGYTFISRNYEPGDRIFITGFSRGAYTARALGGLICAKGLLDASKLPLDDREKAYRLGAAVWNAWRQEQGGGKPWLARLQEAVLDLPVFFSSAPPAALLADVRIAAIGVWDTVGSLGIPAYAGGERIDMFRFADTMLSPKVDLGFHALALDEKRPDFEPTFWFDDPRITQCLFPGAHADVGGGYPITNHESELSDIAFLWMKEQFASIGVAFRPQSPIPIKPDALGCAHEPWRHFPFDVTKARARAFTPSGNFVTSPAVAARRAGGPVKPDPDAGARPYL